ncbi:SKP1-like protein 14 [Raphanus sativus]|nr:SKP1-like protein 14 [Raphanus sativus]
MIEDDCASGSIPLANMAGKTLSVAIEYCKKHVEAGAVENNQEAADKLKKWDEDLLARHDNAMIFDLKGLLNITCKKVADYIKDFQPEEVRQIFNIENGYSEEEEAQVRKENEWAFH